MDEEQREELIVMLKVNRSYSKSGGQGTLYWNTVVDTIERFLDRHFKEEELSP